MEQVKKTMEGVMDSLKPESQDKQTGSTVEICKKHNCELTGDYFIQRCRLCDEEEKLKDSIKKAHYYLKVPERFADCSFETYKPKCSKAKAAKKICQDYADNHSGSGGLIMVGGVGTGKTHLAISMCKAVCDKGVSTKITTVSRMIRKIRASWSKNSQLSEEDIILKYSSWYKFLVIDEIGSQYGSESEKITISEIINDRYNNNLPTVILGNVTMKEAESHLGGRVMDRIKDNGKLVIFDWESHRKLKG